MARQATWGRTSFDLCGANAAVCLACSNWSVRVGRFLRGLVISPLLAMILRKVARGLSFLQSCGCAGSCDARFVSLFRSKTYASGALELTIYHYIHPCVGDSHCYYSTDGFRPID